MHPIETARSAVAILNRLGVSPVILEDERCCGRDMYDIGERETFEKLARHNIAHIRESKARTVLTVCPECAYTLGETYREAARKLPYKVRHVSEFIAERIDELDFAKSGGSFALHDPCYLCRYLDAGGAPRKILRALSGGEPVRMERQGADAPCCGAGSWINHGPHTRASANSRMREAHECGADTLVTACPKCLILFHEASPDCSWKQSPVVVKDLLALAASEIKGREDS
jgi:Fe-S oxidoreductase